MNPSEGPSGASKSRVPRPWRGQSASVEQTMAIAGAVARCAMAGDVIALIGELGSGKTQFVRGLAAGLGLDETAVSSPTFVIVHEYADADEQNVLRHLDAYRVKDLADVESIGWEGGGEAFASGAVVAVEWADRLAHELGPNVLEVRLTHVSESERQIKVTPTGSWCKRMIKLRRGLRQATAAPAAPTLPASAIAPCPICKVPVGSESRTLPFCSPRCRTIDLGRWLGGEYVISRPIEQSDIEQGD